MKKYSLDRHKKHRQTRIQLTKAAVAGYTYTVKDDDEEECLESCVQRAPHLVRGARRRQAAATSEFRRQKR